MQARTYFLKSIRFLISLILEIFTNVLHVTVFFQKVRLLIMDNRDIMTCVRPWELIGHKKDTTTTINILIRRTIRLESDLRMSSMNGASRRLTGVDVVGLSYEEVWMILED